VILGAGKYVFRNVNRMYLDLLGTRTFRNGRVLLTYRPASKEGSLRESG
jgi:hypothetical protein